MRGGVYVLGMHRCGTSAITRVVDLLGVPVASQGLVEQHSEDNPAGYWEVDDLRHLNDRLLWEMGGTWAAPPPLPTVAGADRGLAVFAEEAQRMFRRSHPGPAWTWKDPRNCLTLAFWRSVLEEPAIALIAFRDPGEVAASLALRGYGPPDLAFALWERYLRSAALLAAGLPSLVVDYRTLVSDPETVVSAIAGFLAGHGHEVNPDAPASASNSVVAELYRRRLAAGGRPELSSEQQRLASALREASARGAGLDGLDLGVETADTEYLLARVRPRAKSLAEG